MCTKLEDISIFVLKQLNRLDSYFCYLLHILYILNTACDT